MSHPFVMEYSSLTLICSDHIDFFDIHRIMGTKVCVNEQFEPLCHQDRQQELGIEGINRTECNGK